MTHDPAWMRATARLLSGLLQSDEGDLAAFVQGRLGDSPIDPERVADIQAILVRLGEALREPSPERLMTVEYARRVLDEWNSDLSSEKAVRAPGAAVVAEPPTAPVVAPTPAIRVAMMDASQPSPWAAPAPAQQVVIHAPAQAPQPARRANATAAMAIVEAEAEPLPFGGVPKSSLPLAVADPDATQSGETADVDLAVLTASAAVPFGKAAAKPASAPTVDSLAETVGAAEAPKPPGNASLNLEQYAAFCVERARWPHHRAQICAKYHVAPEAEEALHRHYRLALAASAELKARFEELQLAAQRKLGAR